MARRQIEKEPHRWIDALWELSRTRRFEVRIGVLVRPDTGMLARITTAIGASDANITLFTTEVTVHGMQQLTIALEVRDRVHLARIMRNVRRLEGVERILRERG